MNCVVELVADEITNYKLQIVIICRRKDPKSLFPSRRTLFLGCDNLTSSIRFVATYVCKRKYYTSLSAWQQPWLRFIIFIYIYFLPVCYTFSICAFYDDILSTG